MELKFSPDRPINQPDQDQLDFLTPFVSRIFAALQQTEAPFVFGILGDWGSGKSSTIGLLEHQFRQNPFPSQSNYIFVPIRFDVWKFDSEENMLLPLLLSFRKKFKELFSEDTPTERFKESALAILGSTALSVGDIGFRMLTKTLTGEAYKLQDIKENLEVVESDQIDRVEELFSKWYDSVEAIEVKFADFVEDFSTRVAQKYKTTPDRVRFVVFLDDLDRCLPTTVISIIESVKNHLSVDKCVYFFSLNPKVVSQGIRTKYGGLHVGGREYLEKILNYSFHVPSPEPQMAGRYVEEQIAQLLTIPKGERLEQLGEAVGQCGLTNPRKLKRLVNTFSQLVSNHDVGSLQSEFGNLVRLIVLQEYCPVLFERIAIDESGEFLLDLKDVVGKRKKISEFASVYGETFTSSIETLERMEGAVDLVSSTGSNFKNWAELARTVARLGS